MSSGDHNSSHTNPSPPESGHNETAPDVPGDLDLANAIGDAIKEFAMLESETQTNAQRDESEHDKNAGSGPDVDLASVVGDVFSNFNSHDFHSPHEPDCVYDGHEDSNINNGGANQEQKLASETKALDNSVDEFHVVKHEQESDFPAHDRYDAQPEARDDSSEEKEDDEDLEAAIGDVFKNLAADMNIEEKEQTPDGQTGGSPENSRDQIEDQHSEVQEENHDGGDQDLDENLEDAIGDAFKSLNNNLQGPHLEQTYTQEQEQGSEDTDESLQAAISASLHELLESGDQNKAGQVLRNRRESDAGLDLVGIVQSAVQNITGDSGIEKVRLSKDVISDLASEISHQVQSHEKPKEIPLLDENVLAHFQSKANKDDSDADRTLRAAVANAVNQVLPKSHAPETQPTQEKEPDLEKLQMNEILQNAFNMAMQNPQELLTSLDMDDVDAEKLQAHAGQEKNKALSTAAAIAALSAGALGKKSDEEPLPDKSDLAPAKPLSIAETLALHRATMANAAKRDYSSIQTLEESRPEVANASHLHPQLSNILSSLSQHIQSGTQSQNLMSVIRQMTNALMLNKSKRTNLSSTVQDFLGEMKSQPEEKKFFGDVLRKTRQFLAHAVSEVDSGRSVSVIDVVLGFLECKDDGEFSFQQDISDPSISHLYDSALATLSNYDSLRLRTALLGTKPDVASNEYKERIRIENRERKKRWREENAERNKDNDLRSRVIKRANAMFGEEPSEGKKAWVEEEFSKRREKRIARQRKDEAKPESLPFQDMAHESKLSTGSLTQDSKFSKRLTDCFNLIVECGAEEESQAVLNATAAATAMSSISHANSVGVLDLKMVEAALTQMLGTILDSTVRSGNFKKISFLTKQFVPETTQTRQAPYENSSYSYDYSSKRLGPESLPGPKKAKIADSSNYYTKQSSPEQGAPGPATNLWSSVTGLKMPSYRKPSVGPAAESSIKTETVEKEYPLAPIKASSPFISNKMGIETTPSPAPSGLRKPGSFQRPVFTTPANKSGSLGFPTLYSTSFRSK